jgi:transcription termination factor Rho
MTKAELESKHLSDLHALAAEAGVERFRMLSRSELIAKLSDGDEAGQSNGEAPRGREPREPRERSSSSSSSRRRRSRGGRGRGRGGREGGSSDEVSGRGDKLREEALGREPEQEVAATEPTHAPDPTPAAPAPTPAAPAPTPAAAVGEPERPRRRRRRRFGRRKGGVTIQDLLLPAEAGRQAVLAAESRAACTGLLRGVAADLASASKGPDPVILLIDPTPEELADWKREAPQAEIVAAGQARHANDALAQAASRAGSGDDVILLVDSLTRLADEDFGDTDTAKEFFDAGRAQGSAGGGSLTVVAAIERAV